MKAKYLPYLNNTKFHFPLNQYTLSLKLYGFGGERAYYYDEDLLTMFNQNETQKNLVSLRVEYDIVKELTLIGNYQYTEFQNYIIRYYVGGLKFDLDL